jgi:DNA-binding transcriptional LysR family regulator
LRFPQASADGSLPPNHKAALDNIDLKTLRILCELHTTRSVSVTAANLQVTQSSISMTLARLRKHFKDTLFVRTSMGMEPTPLANELITRSSEALISLEAMLGYQDTFDPVATERTFRIAMTDIDQMVMVPMLLERLGREAPSLTLEVSLISGQTPSLLESGKIDLAVGFLPPLDVGFVRQRIFSEHFVCVMRKDHPRITNELTRETFLRESHAIVTRNGTGHKLLDRALKANKIERRLGIEISNFPSISAVIERTDFLAIVPSRLAAHWQSSNMSIRSLPLPFTAPPYMVMAHWHKRYMRTPAMQWLRGLISGLYS